MKLPNAYVQSEWVIFAKKVECTNILFFVNKECNCLFFINKKQFISTPQPVNEIQNEKFWEALANIFLLFKSIQTNNVGCEVKY